MPLLLAAAVLMVLAIGQAAPMSAFSIGEETPTAVEAAASVRGEQARERATNRQVSRDTRRGRPSARTSVPPPPPVEPAPVVDAESDAPEESTTAPSPQPAPVPAEPEDGPAAQVEAPPAPQEQTTSTPVGPAASGPAAGRTVAFADEFDTLDLGPGRRWGHMTTSYEFGDHNPDNYKRDWVTPDAMQVEGGVLTMTATRRDDFYWNTGLLTTQDFHGVGGNGFRVQAGDFLVNRVMLPTGNTGAWPGLWTWDGPDGEVDAFEWHSDVPDVLEFTNHVRDGGEYFTDGNLIAPGRWVWIGVELGTDNNTWYVGDTLEGMQGVFSDGTGIGDMRPFIIANLSVNVSPWHPSPSGSEPIVYKLDTVRVYR